MGYLSQEISVSKSSGVYTDPIQIEITGDFKKVYFTTDGSEPGYKSKSYSKPFSVNSSTFLRIKPIYDNKERDTIIARSYIFNFTTKLPIMSLGMEPEDLWNDSTGIYAKGYKASLDSTGHWTNANYQKKWEKEIHVIYLDAEKNEQINQISGIKIFGESTRRLPDKSMKLIARKEYGVNRFNYAFFEERKNDSFKQLVIRTSGNDYRNTRFKDVLNAYLARNMGFDYMAFQPIQLFVNGEYWGVYNLREKINEHYLYDNHGAAIDSSSIIMGRWVRQHGSSHDYKSMYNWFLALDTMDDAAYKKAQTMLDMRNYINYRAFQIYINNSDSRGNIRYWNSKDQDGKFRMIMYDTDLGLGNASRKYLEACLSPKRTDWYNPEWSTMYFRKLMQNNQFKYDFINQIAHFMNTSLHRDTIIAAVDHFENIYKNELPRNGKQVAKHLRNVPISMEEWLDNVDHYRMYAKLRYKRLRPEITRILAHKGEFTLLISGENGKIEINENYALSTPFEGIYYKNIPLPIKAVNNENWHFKQWSDGDTSSTKVIIAKQDSILIHPQYEWVETTSDEITKDLTKQLKQPEKVTSNKIEWLEILGYALVVIGFSLLLYLLFITLLKR